SAALVAWATMVFKYGPRFFCTCTCFSFPPLQCQHEHAPALRRLSTLTESVLRFTLNGCASRVRIYGPLAVRRSHLTGSAPNNSAGFRGAQFMRPAAIHALETPTNSATASTKPAVNLSCSKNMTPATRSAARPVASSIDWVGRAGRQGRTREWPVRLSSIAAVLLDLFGGAGRGRGRASGSTLPPVVGL